MQKYAKVCKNVQKKNSVKQYKMVSVFEGVSGYCTWVIKYHITAYHKKDPPTFLDPQPSKGVYSWVPS